MPANNRVSVDSEWAGDRATRNSTTGMVQRLGRHPIKTGSTLKTSVGLNVSECVFYALVRGETHGLGLPAFMSQTAQTRYLWILDIVAANGFVTKTRYQQRTTLVTSGQKQSIAKPSTNISRHWVSWKCKRAGYTNNLDHNV